MKKHIILLSVLALISMTGCGKKESALETSTKTDTSAIETKHVYSSTYSHDDEYHWKKCTTSGHSDTTTKEKHVYDNNLDEDCNVCGYTRTIKHTYGAEWQSDEKSHWKVCTEEGHTDIGEKADHTFGEWTVSVPATYTSDEILERTCTVCGKKEEKTNPDSKLPKQSRELSVSDISDITYDGLTHPITDDMITRTNDFGGLTIEYKLKEDTEYTTDSPVDSGVYDYRVTLKGTDEWEEKVVTGSFTILQFALELTDTTFESNGLDDDGNVILYTYDVTEISNLRDYEVHLIADKSYAAPGRYTLQGDELSFDNKNYRISYPEGSNTYQVTVYDTADLRVAINAAYNITGKGVVIDAMPIMQGTLKKGDNLYVSELGKTINVTALTDSKTRKEMEKATVGDSVDILITGATKDELSYGMLLTKGEKAESHQSVFVDITADTKFITSGSYYNVYFPDTQISQSVRVTLSNNVSTLLVGETNTNARIDFGDTTANWVGREFKIYTPGNKADILATVKVKSLHDHESTMATTGNCTECGLNNVKALTFDSTNTASSGNLNYFTGESYVFTINILPSSTEATNYKFALSVSTSDSTSNYAMKVSTTIGTTTTDVTSTLVNGVLTIPASTIDIKKGIKISTIVVRTKKGSSFTYADFSITKQ